MCSRIILSVYTPAAKLSFTSSPKTTDEKHEFSALKIGQEWELDWCFLKSKRFQDVINALKIQGLLRCKGRLQEHLTSTDLIQLILFSSRADLSLSLLTCSSDLAELRHPKKRVARPWAISCACFPPLLFHSGQWNLVETSHMFN